MPKSDTLFAISFDDFPLTEQQKTRIENKIREVVLRELAQTDHEGDFIASKRLELNPRLKQLKGVFGGIPFGIWIGSIMKVKDIFKED
jgi:hypothetical protein